MAVDTQSELTSSITSLGNNNHEGAPNIENGETTSLSLLEKHKQKLQLGIQTSSSAPSALPVASIISPDSSAASSHADDKSRDVDSPSNATASSSESDAVLPVFGTSASTSLDTAVANTTSTNSTTNVPSSTAESYKHEILAPPVEHSNATEANNNNPMTTSSTTSNSKPLRSPRAASRKPSAVPIPIPINVRGRVVSLDRKVYMRETTASTSDYDDASIEETDDMNILPENDNDISISSNSDDGSYFSEHLPSPKSMARKRQPIMGLQPLPPRRSSGNGGYSNHGRSNSMSGLPMGGFAHQGVAYGRGQDSDLSLSSSSDDESIAAVHGELENPYAMNKTFSSPYELQTGRGRDDQGHLKNSYAMMRTTSAPEPSLKEEFSLKPRNSDDSDHGLSPIVPGLNGSASTGANGDKPPTPSSVTSKDLQTIGTSSGHSDELLLKNKSDGFSLVSSSSDSKNANEKKGQKKTPAVKRHGRHRRQNSCHSVDSLDSSSYLNTGKGNVWNAKQKSDNGRQLEIEDESELSDSSSVAISPRRKIHGRRYDGSSQSRRQVRIPFEVPGPGSSNLSDIRSQGSRPSSVGTGTGSAQSSPGRPKASHSSLNEEQLKLWQVGMVLSESYLSSSAGGTVNEESPDRKLLAKDKSNSSLHMSSVLVYSEDDTDESVRFQQTQKVEHHGLPQAPNGEVSAAGMGPVDHAGGRSFGRDLTNSTRKPHHPKASAADLPHSSSAKSSDAYTSGAHGAGPGLMMNSMIPGCNADFYGYGHAKYKVYWQRWMMLLYMSLLNLLSDWTCFSIAPIATLTSQAYGIGNPEGLVTVFLGANAVATALEPIILSRLGLRKTVVLGSFLLMLGSLIKSGGIPGLIGTALTAKDASWKVYAGFLLVGLSQPLYQCTPTILSCSWFPEHERTFATGVALNSNQLGIGLGFFFGTVLVISDDDIPKYFGLLSILSLIAFIGCFFHFQDAPPSPPSDTARIFRGDQEFPVPSLDRMRQAFPNVLGNLSFSKKEEKKSHRTTLSGGSSASRSTTSKTNESKGNRITKTSRRKSRSTEEKRGSPTAAFKKELAVTSKSRTSKRSNRDRSSKQRHRKSKSASSQSATSENGFRSGMNPSPASGAESTAKCREQIEYMAVEVNSSDSLLAHPRASDIESPEDCRAKIEVEAKNYGSLAPSPMMNGRVGNRNRRDSGGYYDTPQREQDQHYHQQWHNSHNGYHPRNTPQDQSTGHRESLGYNPDTPFANLRNIPGFTPNHHQTPQHMVYGYGDAPQPWYPQNPDPHYFYPNLHVNGSLPSEHHYQYHPQFTAYQHPMYQSWYPPMRPSPSSHIPSPSVVDDGAEPVCSQTGNILDIEIQDDQIFRSIKACFSRKGFTHTVIAFAASGIVLNTLSTYMDYLVTLGGSGRQTVGIIGGSFQVLIMLSSIIIGKITDKTRAYFHIVIAMLVLGAIALAECGINLDAGRGGGLQAALLVAAVLVGPLQPVATELAVDVSFPLCSNTVLVIQQLVSNLCSALFIPFFQMVRDFGREAGEFQRPQYTFSFFLLIVIHAAATVFFATFNGKYRRFEHEQRNKNEEYDEEKTALIT